MAGMGIGTFHCPRNQVIVDVIDWKRANEDTVELRQILKKRVHNKKLNQDEHYSENEESKIEKHHHFVGRVAQGNQHSQTKNDSRSQTAPSIATHCNKDCTPKASPDVPCPQFEKESAEV